MDQKILLAVFSLITVGNCLHPEMVLVDQGTKGIYNDLSEAYDVVMVNKETDIDSLPDFYFGDAKLKTFRGEDQKERGRARRQVPRNTPSQLMYLQDVQAFQYCQGIRLTWKRPAMPLSPTGQYINSEFSHYNVYRSSSYFTTVRGMVPYASGKKEYSLSVMSKTNWVDRDPITNDFLWYAVTLVTRNGEEMKEVTPAKAMYIGAFGPLGPRKPLTPNDVTGVSLHTAGTYNPDRQHYFVAWDVDSNKDGRPDRVLGAIVNKNGLLMHRRVMDMTVKVRGSTMQGMPQVAYNPTTNEYIVVFLVATTSLFGGKSFVASQRISTRAAKPVAPPNVQLKANENVGGQLRWISLDRPRIVYNKITGGYSLTAEMISLSGTRGLIFQNIAPQGKALKTQLIFSAKLNCRESSVVMDTKRNELYILAQFPSRVVNRNSPVAPKKAYSFIVTKRNATGEPLGKTAAFLSGGETNVLVTNLQGYYNPVSDRLHLLWRDVENGKVVIKSSRAFMDANVKTTESDYSSILSPVCSVPQSMSSFTVAPFAKNGGQVILWEEIQSGRQKIGGSLLRVDFALFTGQKQSFPLALQNTHDDNILALWIQQIDSQRSNVFARVVQPVTHKCPIRCAAGYTCMREQECVKSYTASKPCAKRNGKCEETCLNSIQGPKCTCSSAYALGADKRSCIAKGQSPPLFTMLVSSVAGLWQMTSYNDGTKNFQLIPVGFDNIVTSAYDSVEQHIYWSSGSAHTISRAKFDGTNVEVLARSVLGDGIVLDVKERKIYWTDAIGLKIEVMSMNKAKRNVLVTYQKDKPRALEFYEEGGTKYMYWTAWESSPRIERAVLSNDRLSKRLLLISTNIKWPNGLVIDSVNKKMYWADAALDKIEVTDLLGQNRYILGARVVHPYSLLIIQDRIYWSDWTGEVVSANKVSGHDRKVLAQSFSRPAGLHLLKGKLITTKTCSNPGTVKNGGRIGNDFSVDKLVRFVCNKGFSLFGPGRMMCMANGQWSNRKPLCLETKCKYPGKPYHGNAVIVDDSIDGEVIYTCDPGYKLVGKSMRICQSNGKWAGSSPRCIALPVFTKSPSNMTVTFDRSAVIPCKAHGGTTLKITWLKDGRPFNVKASNGRIIMYRTSIFIANARFSDSGLFTCRASNDAGFVETSAAINVLGYRITRCGEPKHSTRQRIFGGRVAGEGAHPWMAMIWNKERSKLICGGTLISDKWIVTAAHCFEEALPLSHIQIKLGTINTHRVDPYEQVFEISTILTHSRFQSKTYDSDIALVKLSNRVIFTDYVIPACLPYDDDDFKLLQPGTLATVTGWGSKSERQRLKQRFTKKLQEIEIPVINQDECARKMSPITPNMFCAGGGIKGDSCQGDSGGPLIIVNPRTKKRVLMGVVSWGEQCAKENTYGVYTRVSNFVAWISSRTQTS